LGLVLGGDIGTLAARSIDVSSAVQNHDRAGT
jgi:hypothetical protein